MIDLIVEPLSNGTTLKALTEIAVLGVVSGAIGCWIVLYELSYSAESLAHGLFPGLVTAALIGAPPSSVARIPSSNSDGSLSFSR